MVTEVRDVEAPEGVAEELCACGACDLTPFLTAIEEQEKLAASVVNVEPAKRAWGVGAGSKPCPLCETRKIPVEHGLCRKCATVRINALYGVTDGKTPIEMKADYRARNVACTKSGNWRDVAFTLPGASAPIVADDDCGFCTAH